MKTFLVFDTETTGIHPERDSIISFSYKIVNCEFKTLEEGTIEMNPFSSLEEASDPEYETALKINGYTPNQILGFMPASEGMKKVADVYAEALKYAGDVYNDVILVGYNSSNFDIPMVKHNARKHGIFIPNYRTIDVYQMVLMLEAFGAMPAKNYPNGQPMKTKLCESVERLGIESDPDKFHSSAYDVEMTFQVFLKIGQLVKVTL